MQDLIREFLAVIDEQGWKTEYVENDGDPFTKVTIPQLPMPFFHDVEVLYYVQNDYLVVEMRFHGRGCWMGSNTGSQDKIERAIRGIIKMKDALGKGE